MTRTPKAGFLFIIILNKMRVVKNEIVFSGEDGRPITTSLVIAEIFGKEHSKVMRDIENLSCSNEFRVANFGDTSYVHPQNRCTYKMYTMTKDGFTFLVMGYTGKKAGEFKEKFINRFNEMEKAILLNQNGLPNFSDPAEAARAWAQQYEEKKELKYKNVQLEQERKENKPKVEFAECIMKSSDCISVGDMANILNQNNLFGKGKISFYRWLRYNGYLIQRGIRYNHPSQKSMKNNLMRLVEVPYTTRGMVAFNTISMITPYGQKYFINLFRKMKAGKSQPELLFEK